MLLLLKIYLKVLIQKGMIPSLTQSTILLLISFSCRLPISLSLHYITGSLVWMCVRIYTHSKSGQKEPAVIFHFLRKISLGISSRSGGSDSENAIPPSTWDPFHNGSVSILPPPWISMPSIEFCRYFLFYENPESGFFKKKVQTTSSCNARPCIVKVY